MSARMKFLLSMILFVLFLGAAFFAYQLLSEDIRPETPIDFSSEENQKKAPDFIMFQQDGKQVKLSDFFGKPIVLNFWASWCPPCKSEMPHFEKVYQSIKEKVMFIMVDLVDGQRETLEKGKRYIADNGYTFPVFYDLKQDAARTYRIMAIPTTIIINKEGNIVTTFQGPMDENALYKAVAGME